MSGVNNSRNKDIHFNFRRIRWTVLGDYENNEKWTFLDKSVTYLFLPQPFPTLANLFCLLPTPAPLKRMSPIKYLGCVESRVLSAQSGINYTARQLHKTNFLNQKFK